MRKGFTLVELLAVIVILAIILAIAIPGISNIINSSKTSAYNSQMDMIRKTAHIYMSEYGSSTTTSVSLSELISAGLLPSETKNPITNQPFDNIIIDVSGGGNPSGYTIYEGPELSTGLIPVYYDDATESWKKADKTNLNNNWYDYNNQKWANAVTVTSTNRSTYQSAATGTTIPMSDINTMFVWIPRYKYLIPAGTGAREIKIQFETKYTPKSSGDAINTYYTHPAFTFGTTEVGGIWVGKFETTGTIASPTIKPNLTSFGNLSVKTMFDGIKTNMQGSSTYGFSTDNDIHMMKNTEWGAVVYLYHSKYGKYGNVSYIGLNKEIYLNNSSSRYTGRSSGAPSASGILTPTYEYIADGYYTYDGKCASINANLPAPCATGTAGVTPLTGKSLAYGASTTGNIYGIYDISGGRLEYVVGMYKPNSIPTTGIIDKSGFSSTTTDSQYDLLTINSKYYNQYLTSSASTNYIKGDATYETSGWYGDFGSSANSASPWITRGGNHFNGAFSGAFNYYGYGEGGAAPDVGLRIVLLLQQ